MDNFSKEFKNIIPVLGTLESRSMQKGVEKKVLSKVTLAHERIEDLRADDLELDITLKKFTLYRLFYFLAAETLAIFILVYLQAFGVTNLEEWTFRILTVSTITQITIMINIAVKHLFPGNVEKKPAS